MKKNYILLTILLVFVSLFLTGCGEEELYYKDYKYKNFKETLEEEGIELENKDYKETDDQAIIYLFRGKGCGFCRAFITYLNTLTADSEYGKKFRVVSFEVWNDAENNAFMKEVANKTGEAAGGVPYIIIGEKVFPGYIADWNEDIKKAIDKEYKNNKNDVMKKLQKGDGFEFDSALLTQIIIALEGCQVFDAIKRQTNEKSFSLLACAECCGDWHLRIRQVGHIRFVAGWGTHRTGLCCQGGSASSGLYTNGNRSRGSSERYYR